MSRASLAAVFFALPLVAVATACPQEEEDPCAVCTDDAEKDACVEALRDCEQFDEGTPEHEQCHEDAAANCN